MRKTLLFRAVECPSCEGMQTPLAQKGHDDEGRVIRRRKCDQCGHSFGTIELVLPAEFVFGATDIDRKDRNRHIRALKSSDRILVGGTIRIVKGEWTDTCMKGLHTLTGTNLVLRPNSRTGRIMRICRACEKRTQQQYHLRNRDQRLHRQRERRAQQKAEGRPRDNSTISR